MFDATIDHSESKRVTLYRLMRDAVPLSFSDVLDLWQRDSEFRTYYARLLADSPFASFRWETPALTTESASQPFQFVLLSAPEFLGRPTDSTTYRGYFTNDDADQGVVSFRNLSGDATLVVPSPRTEVSAYGHLAAFVRYAPKEQVDALWRVVSNSVRSAFGQTPLWLSTAGGGVAWLHVRLDCRPKYYGYLPYKAA